VSGCSWSPVKKNFAAQVMLRKIRLALNWLCDLCEDYFGDFVDFKEFLQTFSMALASNAACIQ
jgi:hypothetical protein